MIGRFFKFSFFFFYFCQFSSLSLSAKWHCEQNGLAKDREAMRVWQKPEKSSKIHFFWVSVYLLLFSYGFTLFWTFFSRKIPSSAPQSSIHSCYIYVFLLFFNQCQWTHCYGFISEHFFLLLNTLKWAVNVVECRRNCASVEFFDKFICVWNSWWMAWPSAMIFFKFSIFY